MAIESHKLVDEANDTLKAAHEQLMSDFINLLVTQEKERKKPGKRKKT